MSTAEVIADKGMNLQPIGITREQIIDAVRSMPPLHALYMERSYQGAPGNLYTVPIGSPDDIECSVRVVNSGRWFLLHRTSIDAPMRDGD